MARRIKKFKNPTLPENWYYDFWEKVDFDQSYKDLGDNPHFYADAMRGRIRSTQLRLDEAWVHFDRAQELAVQAEETIPELMRQFALNMYSLDNALKQGVVTDFEFPSFKIPELPDAVLEEYPEVRTAILQRQRSEALLRLHAGDYEIAADIYRDLLGCPLEKPNHIATDMYVGLAACQYNLGRVDEAMKDIQNAGFSILSGEASKLSRGFYSGLLHGLYTYFGEYEEAESWSGYLQSLEMPAASKKLFLQHGELALRRSREESRLVVLQA